MQASALLNSTLDLDEVLRSLLQEASRIVGAENGFILLREDEDWKLHLSINESELFSRSVATHAAESGKTLLLIDAHNDERFLNTTSVQMGTLRSILCAPVDDTARYGRLDISSEGRIRAFLEKDSGLSGPGVINAGVYLFSAAMLDTIDEMPGPSLERDVFEKLPAGTLNAVTGEGAFIDIGTPDDLARAADVLKPYAQDS